jgi:peroxiredoxin
MADLTLLLLDGAYETEVRASGRDGTVYLEAVDVLAATGWEVKSYGLCRDDVCNPARFADGPISLAELAAALHRPLALEVGDERAVAVLGEAGGSTLQAGDIAPTVTLPDVDGNPVQLTGSGRKTAIVAWSTWCGCRYELPSWLQLADELRPLGLDLVTVALDDDVDAVRKWTSRVEELPVAVDAEHRVSDLFGVVNVPSVVWLDEDGRVVKPPTIAPGDDRFKDFTEVDAEAHHDALRAWVQGGESPPAPAPEDSGDLRTARAERRLAAWLHRDSQTDAAERHFAAAVALAPLDFSIRRASMRRRGQDPFGADFTELWQEWSDAGRPGYAPTTSPS